MISSAKTEMALLETAAKWHFRRESGIMSDADEARFEAWLHANRRHREAYDRVASTLMQVASSAQTSPMLLLRQQALRRARSCIAVRPRYGMCLALVAGAAGAAFVATIPLIDAMPTHIYQTGRHERRIVKLEDGSRVSMDQATLIKVHFEGDSRNVSLNEGQARFQVAHDRDRPFIVDAGRRSVRALGTDFNVDRNHGNITVTLLDGRVAFFPTSNPIWRRLLFSSDAKKSSVYLKPGDSVSEQRSGARLIWSHRDSRNAVAWERGRLIAENEPLQSVVERMQRYTDTRVQFADMNVAAIRISGVFATGDMEGLVDAVEETAPVRANHAPGMITIEARGFVEK